MHNEIHEDHFECIKTDEAITEAVTEYATNRKLHDAGEALATLRRKHL